MRQALVFWFTGLSGSGKTTVAQETKNRLEGAGYKVLMFDGDDIRKRIHATLGFSKEDIKENNSLIAQLCVKNKSNCDVILVPIISPYRESRRAARVLIGKGFYEVFFSADLETVVTRDPKGLYAKAKAGLICNLIGYSPDSVYEASQNPDFVIDAGSEAAEESINRFYHFIVENIQAGKNEIK